MQIVIPMSGFGERFRNAGYKIPKPLINIEQKPLIEHVVDMFPGETNILFVCNQDHLDEPSYRMKEILRSACPTAKIEGIGPHKLGPVHAVQQIECLLNMAEPIIVNYCDFTCYWDWNSFKKFVALTKCSGAIPAYKGFHPHSLGTTNYAYILESRGWIQDIQEKKPFTNNRMEEYASSGTYYFDTAQLMSNAFEEIMAKNLNVGGEFYVSLAYKALVDSDMPVAVYPLQHFMQWGTPEDVSEYNYWSDTFRHLVRDTEDRQPGKGNVIIPMAGLGQRFVDAGYSIPKPLIPVSGKPMVAQAANDLPQAENYSFVVRKDMKGQAEITDEIVRMFPRSVVNQVDGVTEGQACTALIGLDALESSDSGPITIGACDNGALYQEERLKTLMYDRSTDVIVWGIRGYPGAAHNPEMFGWIKEKNNLIESISVKQALGEPASDPIVTGTFTFIRGEDFKQAVERLIDRDGRINGEFYIDSCINDAIALGLTCRLFELDSYLCWGTPNDIKTFEYWQSCFHKWESHPYKLELDHRVDDIQVPHLAENYKATTPKMPL